MDAPPATETAAEQATARRRPANVALGWCLQVLTFATLTLALCNAEAARGWADGLEPSPTSEVIRDVCDRWADVTDALGLSSPRRLVRGAWEKRHAVGWPGAKAQPDKPQR
jgi:hypothetical protein